MRILATGLVLLVLMSSSACADTDVAHEVAEHRQGAKSLFVADENAPNDASVAKDSVLQTRLESPLKVGVGKQREWLSTEISSAPKARDFGEDSALSLSNTMAAQKSKSVLPNMVVKLRHVRSKGAVCVSVGKPTYVCNKSSKNLRDAPVFRVVDGGNGSVGLIAGRAAYQGAYRNIHLQNALRNPCNHAFT